MNRTMNRISAILVLAVVVTSAWALTGGGYDLDWNTYNGGGAASSTGGGFELAGTIGQPDAGNTMASGGFELNGGFWPGVGTPPLPQGLASAASRRTQGAAGPFDIPCPLSGAPATEPRQASAAAAPAMVLTFSQAPGALTCANFVVTNGTCVDPVTVSGSTATVALTGLAKNKCLTISVQGVAGFTGDSDVSVVLREGDVQQNGNINILDLQAIKNQLNKPLDSANFKFDVTCSGSINILDLQATKNNLNALATCP